MLPLVRSKKRSDFVGSPNLSSVGELQGLRILIHPNNHGDSSLSVKSCSKQIKPFFCLNQVESITYVDDCFLKSCFLCMKPLGLDKEVYMYRGDQGFCSEECRNRQIYLDEMKEIEISTKKILASFREGGRCDTSTQLKELRRGRNQPLSSQNNRVVFLYG